MYCIYNIHITVVHNIAVNMTDLNIFTCVYTINICEKNTNCVDQSAAVLVNVSITQFKKSPLFVSLQSIAALRSLFHIKRALCISSQDKSFPHKSDSHPHMIKPPLSICTTVHIQGTSSMTRVAPSVDNEGGVKLRGLHTPSPSNLVLPWLWHSVLPLLYMRHIETHRAMSETGAS